MECSTSLAHRQETVSEFGFFTTESQRHRENQVLGKPGASRFLQVQAFLSDSATLW